MARVIPRSSLFGSRVAGSPRPASSQQFLERGLVDLRGRGHRHACGRWRHHPARRHLERAQPGAGRGDESRRAVHVDTTSAPTASLSPSPGTLVTCAWRTPSTRAQRGLDLGGVHRRALDLEHVVAAAVEPEVAVGIERAEIAGRVEAVGVERGVAGPAADRRASRCGRAAGSRRSRPARTVAPDSGSTMRTSMPSKGCPQLPCLPCGQVEVEPRAAVRPERLGHPEEVRPRAGRGPLVRRQHRGQAARAQARQVGRRETGVGRERARPGRASRGTASPVPARAARGSVGLRHRLGEQRRAGDERRSAGPPRVRRSRRTASGCRGGRRHRRRRASSPDADGAQRARRACGSSPLGAPRLPEVKSTTRSSAGRTAASSASTSASSTAARGRSSTSHTWRRDGSVGCRRPAAVAVATPGATASRSSRYERPRNAGASTRWVTPATWSCASSSGGRSSVLSGTSTPPMRETAAAITAHSMPFGSSRPTRAPLPTPAAASRAASARLSSSSSAWVIDRSVGDDRRLRAVRLAVAAQDGRHGHGRRPSSEALLQRAGVELAARQHRHLVVGEHEEALRHLVGRQPLAQRRRGARRCRAACPPAARGAPRRRPARARDRRCRRRGRRDR